MRQLLQSLNTGEIELLDVPCPALRSGHLLIQTHTTLISAGTERMLVEFGKAGLLAKARQQPERVRDVLDKVRSQGLLATVEAVRSKLNESIPLGYCNVGQVLEAGEGCEGFAVGDRVVSNGSHAEVVCVPQNLCAKIPDGVTNEDAAFTVVGAIGLQGIRLAEPTLGEAFVVTGLGLIGLLTTQLLMSNGCRVLGVDFDQHRLDTARSLGAEAVHAASDVVEAARKFSRGRGVDGVLVTASCKSDEPIHQAAQMCRKRGRIVLVGATGLHLQRSDFYEKELQFRVSCSYGPGRYDPQYEDQGVDYPIGFVRWTEQRNFEAILDQFSSVALSASALQTHEFPFENAGKAYDAITDKNQAALGVLLRYSTQPAQTPLGLEEAAQTPLGLEESAQTPLGLEESAQTPLGLEESAQTPLGLRSSTVSIAVKSSASVSSPQSTTDRPRVALIGAGNFAKRMLLPNLKRQGADVVAVASRAGLTAATTARSLAVPTATTDWRGLLDRNDVDALAIATRHDSHAPMTLAALQAKKHVFVEKPLALTRAELAQLDVQKANAPDSVVMVGFNRRFAPMVQTVKNAMRQQQQPKAVVITVNAGSLPADHWTHNPLVGGGRILGEGCHFIDLARFLIGAPIQRVQATMMDQVEIATDKMMVTLAFADGSTAAIHYLANGSRLFPKSGSRCFATGRCCRWTTIDASAAMVGEASRTSGTGAAIKGTPPQWPPS